MALGKQRIDPDRYQVIPRTLTFLLHREHVLLLRLPQSAGPWSGRLNGIGGHIEPGESALAAAGRELAEETGIQPPELRLCGTVLIHTESPPGIALYVFAGEAADLSAEQKDAGEPVWVANQELDLDAVVEDLSELLPRVIAVLRQQAPPFNGLYVIEADGSVQISWSE